MRFRAFRALGATAFAWFVMAMATACIGDKVFDEYQQLPEGGWDKNDTLSFSVPSVAHGGLYDLGVGLRTNGEFPFMNLTIIVETEIFAPDTTASAYRFPKQKNRRILSCPLVNKRGQKQGQGVSLYQYNFHVATLNLSNGDSLRVNIRHNMKREVLPGLNDLGIKLEQTGR